MFGELIEPVERVIQEAEDAFESVMVYSRTGASRPLTVLAGCLIKRYHWSLDKTREYLEAKWPGMSLKSSHWNALKEATREFAETTFLSKDWHHDLRSPVELREEELLLTNTFLNNQKLGGGTKLAALLSKRVKSRSYEKKPMRTVVWADQLSKGRVRAKSSDKTSKPFLNSTRVVIKRKGEQVEVCYPAPVDKDVEDGGKSRLYERKAELGGLKVKSRSQLKLRDAKKLHKQACNLFQRKGTLVNTINTSLSKSTNAQDEGSYADKKADGKTNVLEAMDSARMVASMKNLKANLLKYFKQSKLKKQEGTKPENELDPGAMLSSKHTCRLKRTKTSEKLDQMLRDQKLRTEAWRVTDDVGRLSVGSNRKGQLKLDDFKVPALVLKTRDSCFEAKLVIQSPLEHKGTELKTLDCDVGVAKLKMNKRVDPLNGNRGLGSKRASSAPDTSEFIRRAQSQGDPETGLSRDEEPAVSKFF